MKMKTFLLIASFAVVACHGSAAHGGLTITSLVGGQPVAGGNYVTFDSLPLGTAGGFAPNVAGSASTGAGAGITVSFTPDAQLVNTAVSGAYAQPVLSGGNGANFSSQPDGTDTTKYITSGSNGSVSGAQVTLALPGLELYFGLLWGSVDLYNTLTFYNTLSATPNVPVGTITGGDVNTLANGDQGADGTFYVNINSTTAFNKVVATSSQYAFEFDNVAYSELQVTTGAAVVTPEPSSMVVWSLLGLAMVSAGKWRRKQSA